MVTQVCPSCRGSLMEDHQLHGDFDTTKSSYCLCHRSQQAPKTVLIKSSRRYNSKYFTDSGPRTFLKVFVWILLLLPSTMSNPLPSSEVAGPSVPSSSQKSKRVHDHPAKWINPCRIPSSIPSFPVDMDIEIVTQSDSEIFQNIITQVHKAEYQAKKFMHSYYKETFGEDLASRDKFSEVHYDFLKDINEKVKKSLGAKLTREELEELKIAETLRSMYAGLQSFAVGLEQIVLDQSVYGGLFHKDFQEAEYQLKYVLCELQIAMLEKGISHEDITREIMNSDYRDIDCDTIRNIRDWVIFRDYVNTLEYIHQSFQHFLRNLEFQS